MYKQAMIDEIDNSIVVLEKHITAAKVKSRASDEFRLGQIKTGKLAMSLFINLKETFKKMDDRRSFYDYNREIVKKRDVRCIKKDVLLV